MKFTELYILILFVINYFLLRLIIIFIILLHSTDILIPDLENLINDVLQMLFLEVFCICENREYICS